MTLVSLLKDCQCDKRDVSIEYEVGVPEADDDDDPERVEVSLPLDELLEPGPGQHDVSIDHESGLPTGEETYEVFVTPELPASSSFDGPAVDDDDNVDDGRILSIAESSSSQDLEMLVEECKWDEESSKILMDKVAAESQWMLSTSSYIPTESSENLILHHACMHQAPLQIIESMLQAHPQAIYTPGHLGFLPLHYACFAGAPFEVIDVLLAAYPVAIKVREERYNRLPLHLAAKKGVSVEAMVALISYFPEASMIRDDQGRLPIDYARRIKDAETREGVFSCLSQAPIFIAASRATASRLEQEFYERSRAAENEYERQLDRMKVIHEEEIVRITGSLLDTVFNRDRLLEEVSDGEVKMEILNNELNFREPFGGQSQDTESWLYNMEMNSKREQEFENFKSEQSVNGLENALQENAKLLENVQTRVKEQEKLKKEMVQMQAEHYEEVERLMEYQNVLALQLERKEVQIEELERKLEEEQKRNLELQQSESDAVAKLQKELDNLKKIDEVKNDLITRIRKIAQMEQQQLRQRVMELMMKTLEQQQQLKEFKDRLSGTEELSERILEQESTKQPKRGLELREAPMKTIDLDQQLQDLESDLEAMKTHHMQRLSELRNRFKIRSEAREHHLHALEPEKQLKEVEGAKEVPLLIELRR